MRMQMQMRRRVLSGRLLPQWDCSREREREKLHIKDQIISILNLISIRDSQNIPRIDGIRDFDFRHGTARERM